MLRNRHVPGRIERRLRLQAKAQTSVHLDDADEQAAAAGTLIGPQLSHPRADRVLLEKGLT